MGDIKLTEKNIITKDAEDYDVWHQWGQLFHKKGNLEEAEQAYQRALELNPNNPLIRHNYAVLQHQLDEEPEK